MPHTVTILGCGWLGNALKTYLEPGCHVQCASRDTRKDIHTGLYRCNTLVVAIPPRSTSLRKLTEVFQALSPITQVILVSSLSFYRGHPTVIAVETLLNKTVSQGTIVRMGGLMGYDRIAGKYSAGTILETNTPTRYIHRDDAVRFLALLITQDIRGLLCDLIAPVQRDKRYIYDKNAEHFGFAKTHFQIDRYDGSLHFVDNSCTDRLHFEFSRPDVHDFW